MAFQAGYVNAGGFLACHRFVSHVTGFGTQLGYSLTRKDWLFTVELAMAPLSFIGGAACVAMLIDRELIHGREPHVRLALFIMSAIASLVWVAGELGLFGVFGEPLLFQRDFILLFSLCFLCGFQNALFVSLSTGAIRTTHLTGIATDIGINLVRQKHLTGEEKSFVVHQNYLRIATFVIFTFGSMSATLVFPIVEYHGFVVPALLSVSILIYIFIVFSRENFYGKNVPKTH